MKGETELYLHALVKPISPIIKPQFNDCLGSSKINRICVVQNQYMPESVKIIVKSRIIRSGFDRNRQYNPHDVFHFLDLQIKIS